MTKLTFDHVFDGFGIHHCPRQQVSYATLLDDSGNVVTPEVVLERDGHDHVSGIFAAVEDYWHEQDRINGTGDYDETTTQEHAA